MIKIQEWQIKELSELYFEEKCIEFIAQELSMFDITKSKKNIKSIYDKKKQCIPSINKYSRVSLILIIISHFVFSDELNIKLAGMLSQHLDSPYEMRWAFHNEILLYNFYDSEFLERKEWI